MSENLRSTAMDKTQPIDTQKSNNSVNRLLNKVLKIEKIGNGLYRSTYQAMNSSRRTIYGGQVVGLALLAAVDTVDPEFQLHSLHSYFLKAGIDQPIVYLVESTRVGNTFCSRSVKAVQNGEAIFTMQCSFKKTESETYSHQFKMPDVPQPDLLLNKSQLYQDWIDDTTSDEEWKRDILKPLKSTLDNSAWEMRPVDPLSVRLKISDEAKIQEPRDAMWIKIRENIGGDQQLHRCIAAYMSDVGLLATAAGSQVAQFGLGGLFTTSLDHSMWFHNDVRADEWMLYELESPVAGEGRAFCTGRLWSTDGKLLITVAQEGVMRTIKSKL